MSKIDEVRSAMVAAMKAKDKDTKRHYLLFLQPLRTKPSTNVPILPKKKKFKLS